MRITLSISDKNIIFNCNEKTLFIDFIKAVHQACKEYNLPVPNQYFRTGSESSYTTADLSRSLEELGFQADEHLSTIAQTPLRGSRDYDYSRDLSLHYPVETMLRALAADMKQAGDGTPQANALLSLYYQHQLITCLQIKRLHQAMKDTYNYYIQSGKAYSIYHILPMMEIPRQAPTMDAKEKDSSKLALSADTPESSVITYSPPWKIHCQMEGNDFIIPCFPNDSLRIFLERVYTIFEKNQIPMNKLPVHYFNPGLECYSVDDLEAPLSILSLVDGSIIRTSPTFISHEKNHNLSLENIQKKIDYSFKDERSDAERKEQIEKLFKCESKKLLTIVTSAQKEELVAELKKSTPNVERVKALIGDTKFLYLRNERIGSGGAKALAAALKENTMLINLDCSGNEIGDTGAIAIAAILEGNTTVRKLNLYWNEIGDTGVIAIAAALKANATLINLDLARNNIGEEGATAIATALERNTMLAKLNLDSNKIGVIGVKALAAALKRNTTLLKLNVKHNYYESAGATKRLDTFGRSPSFITFGSVVLGAVYDFATSMDLEKAIKVSLARNRRHQRYQQIYQASLSTPIVEEIRSFPTAILRIIIQYYTENEANNEHASSLPEEVTVTPNDIDDLLQLLIKVANQPTVNNHRLVVDINSLFPPSVLRELLEMCGLYRVREFSLTEKLHMRDILMQMFKWSGLESVADINLTGQLVIDGLSQTQLQKLAQALETFRSVRRPDQAINPALRAFLSTLSFTEPPILSSTETATAPPLSSSSSVSHHSQGFFPPVHTTPQDTSASITTATSVSKKSESNGCYRS